MAKSYREIYQLNADINQVAAILRDVDFGIALNLELKSENPSGAGVWFRFHHGMTMASYGEKITISLNPSSSTTTSVDILSECGMPTQLVDYGKNRSNVLAIYKYMCDKTSSFGNTYAAGTGNDMPNQTPSYANSPAFCGKCGAKLRPEALFCGNCGAKQR